AVGGECAVALLAALAAEPSAERRVLTALARHTEVAVGVVESLETLQHFGPRIDVERGAFLRGFPVEPNRVEAGDAVGVLQLAAAFPTALDGDPMAEGNVLRPFG